MNTKTCFKCGENKPLTEFYRHPQMGDGLLGKCKSCTRKDVIENRLKKLDYYQAYDTRRHRARGCKPHCKNPIPWKKRNPRKGAAHTLLGTAIRAGRISRPETCSSCGESRPHGHHENYDKPLDVIWLCPLCHKRRHKEMKKEGIEP